MKQVIVSAIASSLLFSGAALAESMEITTSTSRPHAKGPSSNFDGDVVVAPLFPANPSTPATGGFVTFEPGARSAWHTHPAGQFLIVTNGAGWVQEDGGQKREIKQGDVIWTPPGVKHWHGATTTHGMSHIAITNVLNGKNVNWMEQVSDEQYRN